MNKKIKAIIEFIKVHRKESIGVAVALGIAVTGASVYAINKNYNNKNNIALAEKKEDTNTKESENVDENKSTNEEITVEEQEDGTLIVKDKEGKTIADSSKGDDISKVIEQKKEAGSDVNIKNKNGEIAKVEKNENSEIKVEGTGGTSISKPNSIQIGEKIDKVEDIKGTTASSEGSITIVKPNKDENSSNTTPSTPQVKPEEPKPQEKPQQTPQVKPEEQKPTEKPQEQKPVEKPVEKPKRTWEYQSSMTNELWSLFNKYRQENGLNALNWSSKYANWTKQHAEEMAQKESGFHRNYPEGGQIVYDGSAYTTASSILNGFKTSLAHNKNMLDSELTEGACAVYKDSNGRYYVVIGFDY
ncbi:CAP domain-containing protein [Clostridium perfringens]|uniref:CAP domain-containing protein n=1 Tax=Clostridium perfringens TaxID=1502 RepID=UPI002246A1BA|nr:CAP domain-containing protein [Clostridium perfringens]MCX0355836.1 CAP domain-containing protein [Clostridium perfringens]